MVFIIIFFLNSVLRPFQDNYISYETSQSVGGRKRENPVKELLAHPQAVFKFFIKTLLGTWEAIFKTIRYLCFYEELTKLYNQLS